ncbi:MAG: hypothetical protein AAF478_12715 [Pseudomonadota bacterium]
MAAIYSNAVAKEQVDSEKLQVHTHVVASLKSQNSQLTEYGPDASAEFSAVCEDFAGLQYRFKFPGYPFSADAVIPFTISFSSGESFRFDARRGANHDEIIMNPVDNLIRLERVVKNRGKVEALVELHDSDGEKIKAKFHFLQFFQSHKYIEIACG